MDKARDGYVTATEYTSNFYSQHSISTIDAAHSFQGNAPVRSNPSFRAFELGCGTGLTTVLSAAAHPEAEFAANDFMPEHIATANDLVAKLELKNATFSEESFGDLLIRDHEPYDYIVAHGVYTWVSEERKAEVRAFVDQNLKPGGNLSISYNCRAGWSPLLNIGELFRALLAEAPDKSEPDLGNKILRKIQTLYQLDDSGFKADSAAAKFVEKTLAQNHDSRYLIHEYGHDHWNPVYSAQVIREFGAYGLDYAGSPSLLLNIPQTCLPPAAQELVAQEGSIMEHQTLVDMALGQSLRVDLYRRGLTRLEAQALRQSIGDRQIVLALPLEECKLTVKIPTGEMALDDHFYSTLLQLAERGGQTINDFCMLGAQMSVSDADMIMALAILYGVGYIRLSAPFALDLDYADAMNERIAHLALTGHKSLKALISPITRDLLNVSHFNMLMYLAGELDDPEALKQAAIERVKRDGITIRNDQGVPVTDAMLNQALNAHAQDFIDNKVPVLESYGVVR